MFFGVFEVATIAAMTEEFVHNTDGLSECCLHVLLQRHVWLCKNKNQASPFVTCQCHKNCSKVRHLTGHDPTLAKRCLGKSGGELSLFALEMSVAIAKRENTSSFTQLLFLVGRCSHCTIWSEPANAMTKIKSDLSFERVFEQTTVFPFEESTAWKIGVTYRLRMHTVSPWDATMGRQWERQRDRKRVRIE